MASKTLDKCCTEGIKHTGTPLGEFFRIEDIEAYASGDKSAPQVIIIYSDIFGHSFVNTQLIADSFAKENYFVIVPDLFKGDLLRPGFAVRGDPTKRVDRIAKEKVFDDQL